MVKQIRFFTVTEKEREERVDGRFCVPIIQFSLQMQTNSQACLTGVVVVVRGEISEAVVGVSLLPPTPTEADAATASAWSVR